MVIRARAGLSAEANSGAWAWAYAGDWFDSLEKFVAEEEARVRAD